MVAHEAFVAGDVYIDDPYQDCKFRYEHETDRVFARPYGSRTENEISRANSYWARQGRPTSRLVARNTILSRHEFRCFWVEMRGVVGLEEEMHHGKVSQNPAQIGLPGK